MTNEELIKLHQNGDKTALNKLVELNTGMVYKIANKFYVEGTSSIDKEDLQQEGFLGLIAAADKYKFDVEHPCKFSTYAVYWIYQKIHRFITTKNTNDEISINIPTGEDNGKEMLDYIEGVDYSFENVEERLYLQQLRQELDQVMNDKLSLKERDIIKLHFGWNKNNAMPLSEIGEIFNISGERIRQLESKAFLKIRHTPWGRIKGNEMHIQRKKRSRISYSSVINDIAFAEKYLMDEVL